MIFLDGECQITYGAAAADVAIRARRLTDTAKGRPVLLKGSNSAEWVLSFLAARTAGLVVVPFSLDTTAEQQRVFGTLLGSYYVLETPHGTGLGIDTGNKPQTLPARAGFGLMTSGSTGPPRCALRTDASLLAEGQRYVSSFGLTSADRILAALPLCHAFVLGLALGGAIASGCTLYLLPRFVPRRMQQLLRAGQCSILPLVPASARVLCEAFRDGGPAPRGLRHVIIGAGPVTPQLEQEVIAQCGCVPARNYGSSETGATLGTTGQVVPPSVTGKALPGIEAAIAGDEPVGALFVRAAEPFIGYIIPEGIDASRISPDGWFSTGDLAHRDAQGWLTMIRRLGDGLRRGGRFIQPTEVEQALRSHPDVADVVVVGQCDARGEDGIAAHVETVSGKPLSIEDLRRHMTPLIEAYKLPTVWHFYPELPRTPGGKPDRSRLAQPTAE
jgi:acyl-CoA synthetase (AMP-forming)/AMP-acid ligase II